MIVPKYIRTLAKGIGIAFNDVAESKGQSPERIQKNSQRIQSEAEKFARNLIKHATKMDDGDIANHNMVQLGSIKTIEAILRKAHNDYDGDLSQVADGCRLQILTDDARNDEKIFALLEKEYKHAQRKHDPDSTKRNDSFKFNDKIRYLAHRNNDDVKELVEFKDHVSKPKKWGWMGTMVKLEVNIGKGYYVPFEIQMFPKAMKEAYDESHKLYSLIKSDVEDWERYCDIHDNIKNSRDFTHALEEHHDFLNPQYKQFRNTNGKTDISTFFSCIRHKHPYNISAEHNQEVLDTLQKMMSIHKEAAQRCGLLQTKRFTQSNSTFPVLTDADASIKEIDIEPLEGYTEMRKQAFIESEFTPEDIEGFRQGGLSDDDILETALLNRAGRQNKQNLNHSAEQVQPAPQIESPT